MSSYKTNDKHKFPYEWTLKEAKFTKDKGTVFSCFSCGGGSTMGYKLAGFDVIGCNEIDPKMMEAYITNHNPKFSFLEPIQTFKLREDLPQELYELDILDGSPPCSSFSEAGNREKDWGKEKKFREGQVEQVLDTLFFDFIDLAKKLQPKVIIAENVKGLLIGNSMEYVHRIIKQIEESGYCVGYKLLDSSSMGVPQKRERVFFYAIRKDLYNGYFFDLFQTEPILDLMFSESEIPYGDIELNSDVENMPPSILSLWKKMNGGSGKLSLVHEKGSFFTERVVFKNKPIPTITGKLNLWNYQQPRGLTNEELTKCGSFPSDYNFIDNKPVYIIGMSVPPVMIAQIATRIYEQWLKPIKRN